MNLVDSAVHLRSFLDPPAPHGHTIKGSGLVSFRSNRFNTTTEPMNFTLHRACEDHMQSLGVQGSDYDYGTISMLSPNALVSINGRRYSFPDFAYIS